MEGVKKITKIIKVSSIKSTDIAPHQLKGVKIIFIKKRTQKLYDTNRVSV